MSLLDLLALLPILILAFGGTTILMAGAWYGEPRPLIAGGILTALLAALAAGMVAPPTSEIAGLFSAGGYARFFTIFWSLLAAAGLMLADRFVAEKNLGAGEYVSLVLYGAAGMALLSSATHLLGIFLALETFTLVFYILIACNRQCELAAEAGLKYLLMGAVATGFMAFGIALIYASTGSLALPDAVTQLTTASGELHAWGLLGWGMILIAVGFKISLAPFHLWTPDVYQGAPAPVAALLATGSKGAVVAALVGLLAISGPIWHDLVGLIWLTGGIDDVGRRLQRAYAKEPQAPARLLFCNTHGNASDWPALPNLRRAGCDNLLPGGLCCRQLRCFCRYRLPGGQARRADGPLMIYADWDTAIRRVVPCLVLLLLSLAGLPATAGFMAKFTIFHAALQAGYVGLVMLGVLASVVSFAFYLRVSMLLFQSDESAATLACRLAPRARGARRMPPLQFCCSGSSRAFSLI